MKTILLIGKCGQLGWELNRACLPLGQVIALDSPEVDVTDRQNMLHLAQQVRPAVILNATAYTAVDRAESEPELVQAVNCNAPGYLAEAADSVGAALVHFSTDYVFDGGKGTPYLETDIPRPLGIYGQSKLAGERAILQVDGAYLIFRTSWLYSLRRESFVTKVLNWARRQSTLRVVADQVGNPTWSRPMAEAIAQLLAMGGQDLYHWILEHKGLFHLAGDGYASRLEWAQAILDSDPHPHEQTVREVLPALTAEFPTPAQRPLFSALDCRCFTEVFGLRLPPWEEALRLALDT